MRDHAHTLSDFRVPTLSIECEPCGQFGRYNVARLMEKYGDAKLPELRLVLAADCPKAKTGSFRDRCQVRLRQRQPPLMIAPQRKVTTTQHPTRTGVCRFSASAWPGHFRPPRRLHSRSETALASRLRRQAGRR